MSLKLFKNRIVLAGVLITILFLAVGGFYFYKVTFDQGFVLGDRGINILADFVASKCEAAPYRPTCYEEEIPKLVGKITMEDAFRLTKAIQGRDPAYAYCHVLAHKISFAEAQRGKQDWREILTRCPFTMCNYGCLHGSLIERFRGEVLDEAQTEAAIEELKDVCEPRGSWNPTPTDQNMCYHALGHLAVYITGADILKANNFCSKVSSKDDGRDYYEICVEGVYMTIYQGIDPEEIALVAHIKPEKEEVRDYCAQYQGVEYEVCNRESYPLFREELKKASFASDFCSYTTDEHGLWKCYAIAASNITVDFLERNAFEEISPYCLEFPGRFKSQCFANVAVRMVQIEPQFIDKAVSTCEEARKNQMEEECYRDLTNFAAVAFFKGSEARQDFCAKFPTEEQNQCLSAE